MGTSGEERGGSSRSHVGVASFAWAGSEAREGPRGTRRREPFLFVFLARATLKSQASPRARVASLDVLDYQAGLDAALAKEGLPAALRRSAIKDARRVVDAMAFRFALMDERPMPEDLDYLRALEAVKRPEAVARVLLRRRGVYASSRRRRLVTTWAILAVVALFATGLAYYGTSEESVVLAEFSTSTSTNRTFVVTENFTRVHVDATVLHPDDAVTAVEIYLYGPDDETIRLWPATDARNNYLRRNLDATEMPPGEWRLLVDFNEAGGSVYMTILGVQPAR